MFDYLEKIRALPSEERTRFAFTGAVSVTMVLFVVWLTVAIPRIARETENTDQTASSAQASFDFMRQEAGGTFSGTNSGAQGQAPTYNENTLPPAYFEEAYQEPYPTSDLDEWDFYEDDESASEDAPEEESML